MLSKLFWNAAPVNLPCEAVRPTSCGELWVTGYSPMLHRKLVKTSGSKSTVVVRPRTPCDADILSNQTLNLIADTIVHRKVRRVIVCGEPDDAIAHDPTEHFQPQENERSFDQLLHRICARQQCQRTAQRHVIARLDQIRNHARVASALSSQCSSLCGMFYVPECDNFLVYDRAVDRFVPVTG